MGARHGPGNEPFGADRELADTLREVNELRRARSLPEYTSRTNRVTVLPRFRPRCRALRCRPRAAQGARGP
jgi:hypothetical protein